MVDDDPFEIEFRKVCEFKMMREISIMYPDPSLKILSNLTKGKIIKDKDEPLSSGAMILQGLA
jgi:hypothetical protein